VLCRTHSTVFRPSIPLDFLGRTVGAAESRVVSMFAACAAHEGKTVLVIDDADQLLGSGTKGGSPLNMRCKQVFLASLDCLRESLLPNSVVLLVSTAKDETIALVHRFDRTFYLDLPSEGARRDFLVDVLGISFQRTAGNRVVPQLMRDMLESVVESTAGRSYAEMIQLCRHALVVDSNADASDHSAVDALEHFKVRLSQLTPASLRDSVLDSYVDLNVLGSHDLTSTVKGGAFDIGERFPFRGSAATSAWKELVATIVIPLCRAKTLNSLLDCSGSGSRRVLAGGVLLTGPPGSGKSALALHCAKYAASLAPSIKLLEVSCTSLIHKELGGSERAVHHLFEAARHASPCILVLDGIENVAAVRGNDLTSEGTLDRVLSTLLIELDGVDDFTEAASYSIAVIGISSDERWIDPAVKRPGRLQKVVRLAMDWMQP
jgi:SpoVK/Ycf46/Vps4 family AAA+-type ATPase